MIFKSNPFSNRTFQNKILLHFRWKIFLNISTGKNTQNPIYFAINFTLRSTLRLVELN